MSFLKSNITERFIYFRLLYFLSPLFPQERLQVILLDVDLKTLPGFIIILSLDIDYASLGLPEE